MALVDVVRAAKEEHGNGVFILNAYNMAAEEEKGIFRDLVKNPNGGTGIIVDPGEFVYNLNELFHEGYHPTSLHDAINGQARPGQFVVMLSDGFPPPLNLLAFQDEFNQAVERERFSGHRDTPFYNTYMDIAYDVPVGLIGSNKPSWTNRIENALESAYKKTAGNEVVFKAPVTGETLKFLIKGEDRAEDRAVVAEVRQRLKDISQERGIDGDDFSALVCQSLGVEEVFESNHPLDRKMPYDQFGKVANARNTAIRGFKHSNPYVSMSKPDIIEDFCGGNEDLMQNCGFEAVMLSYPEGKYNQDTMELAKNELGCKAAFTMDAGVFHRATTNLYAIPRITVDMDALERNPDPRYSFIRKGPPVNGFMR